MFQHRIVVSRPPENRKSPLGLMDKLKIGPWWPLKKKKATKKPLNRYSMKTTNVIPTDLTN